MEDENEFLKVSSGETELVDSNEMMLPTPPIIKPQPPSTTAPVASKMGGEDKKDSGLGDEFNRPTATKRGLEPTLQTNLEEKKKVKFVQEPFFNLEEKKVKFEQEPFFNSAMLRKSNDTFGTSVLSDDQDSLFTSGTLNDMGALIDRKIQAKKLRVIENFKMIQGPETYYKLQQVQAWDRREGYRKYENALENFSKQMEAIQARQEKSLNTFSGMFKSLNKRITDISKCIEKIKEQVVSVVDNMAEAMGSLEDGLKECNEKLGRDLTASLQKLETKYIKEENKKNVELANAIGGLATMIYTYAG